MRLNRPEPFLTWSGESVPIARPVMVIMQNMKPWPRITCGQKNCQKPESAVRWALSQVPAATIDRP